MFHHEDGVFESVSLINQASDRLSRSLPQWEIVQAAGTVGTGATGDAALPNAQGTSRFDSSGAAAPYETLGILQGPDTMGNFGPLDNLVVMSGRRPFVIGLSPWAWT